MRKGLWKGVCCAAFLFASLHAHASTVQDKEREDARLNQQRVDQQLEEQRLEDRLQEQKRRDDQLQQRKLDDARWERSRGR